MNVVSVLQPRIPLERLISANHRRKVIPVACPASLGPAGAQPAGDEPRPPQRLPVPSDFSGTSPRSPDPAARWRPCGL